MKLAAEIRKKNKKLRIFEYLIRMGKESHNRDVKRVWKFKAEDKNQRGRRIVQWKDLPKANHRKSVKTYCGRQENWCCRKNICIKNLKRHCCHLFSPSRSYRGSLCIKHRYCKLSITEK